jgi:hypothetical protein
MILSIHQDIWAAVKRAGLEIGKGHDKPFEAGKG